MRVLGSSVFQDGAAEAVRTDDDSEKLNAVIRDLAMSHSAATHRMVSIHIGSVRLWGTSPIVLSSGEYRITWRYEEREDEEVIVCYTLASVERSQARVGPGRLPYPTKTRST